MQFGPIAGFHSKHQRYISKDRELLKVLEAAVGKGRETGALISRLSGLLIIVSYEILLGDPCLHVGDVLRHCD